MSDIKGRLKVFVPLRSGQDYKAAEEYGEIVAITPETVDRYNTHQLYEMISTAMVDATQNDMILISGLTLSNCIATAIMARKFGAVSFLIFRRGEYLMRRVILPPLDFEVAERGDEGDDVEIPITDPLGQDSA